MADSQISSFDLARLRDSTRRWLTGMSPLELRLKSKFAHDVSESPTTGKPEVQQLSLEADLAQLSKEQFDVVRAVMAGRNVFLTGSAGTGKTRVINAIMKMLSRRRKIALTASTGLAATHIGGCTIHSWAGIGRGEDHPLDLYFKISNSKGARSRWRKTDILIIDEVSMLSGFLLDKLDFIAKHVRGLLPKAFAAELKSITPSCSQKDVHDKAKMFEELGFIDIERHLWRYHPGNYDSWRRELDNILKGIKACFDRPFGGMQVVLSGDFLQFCFGAYLFLTGTVFKLPPVEDSKTKRCTECGETNKIKHPSIQELNKIICFGRCRKLDNQVGEGEWEERGGPIRFLKVPYAFQSRSWEELGLAAGVLRRVFRQSDQTFQAVLADIRVGNCTQPARKLITSCLHTKLPPGVKPVKMYPTNSKASGENMLRFDELHADIYVFSAADGIDPLMPTTPEIDKDPVDTPQPNEDVVPVDAPQDLMANSNLSRNRSSDQPQLTEKEKQELLKALNDSLQVEREVRLKVGCQVMLLVNLDTEEQLVNGSLGVVIGFQKISRKDLGEENEKRGRNSKRSSSWDTDDEEWLEEYADKHEFDLCSFSEDEVREMSVDGMSKNSKDVVKTENVESKMDESDDAVATQANGTKEGNHERSPSKLGLSADKRDLTISTPVKIPTSSSTMETEETKMDSKKGEMDGTERGIKVDPSLPPRAQTSSPLLSTENKTHTSPTFPSGSAHEGQSQSTIKAAQHETKPRAIKVTEGGPTVDRYYPVVRFNNGHTLLIVPCKFDVNLADYCAYRWQIPLKLAWALTIHKSQGMSIDCCSVDLGNCFVCGQFYTAVSRARSREGLHIMKFKESGIKADPIVLNFYRQLEASSSSLAHYSHPVAASESRSNVPLQSPSTSSRGPQYEQHTDIEIDTNTQLRIRETIAQYYDNNRHLPQQSEKNHGKTTPTAAMSKNPIAKGNGVPLPNDLRSVSLSLEGQKFLAATLQELIRHETASTSSSKLAAAIAAPQSTLMPASSRSGYFSNQRQHNPSFPYHQQQQQQRHSSTKSQKLTRSRTTPCPNPTRRLSDDKQRKQSQSCHNLGSFSSAVRAKIDSPSIGSPHSGPKSREIERMVIGSGIHGVSPFVDIRVKKERVSPTGSTPGDHFGGSRGTVKSGGLISPPWMHQTRKRGRPSSPDPHTRSVSKDEEEEYERAIRADRGSAKKRKVEESGVRSEVSLDEDDIEEF